MKNTLMMVVGAASGIGLYIGIETMVKNKKKVKRKINNLIDDTADLMN